MGTENWHYETIDGEKKRISNITGKEVRPYNKSPNTVDTRNQNLVQNVIKSIPEGENTRYITHTLEVQQIGIGSNPNDLDDLKARFIKYLEVCAKNDMKLGNMAAYCAMGITKDMAYEWEHGHSRGVEHKMFIRFVKSVIAAYRESAVAEGKINPVIGIFWQKAFDGLNELTEVEASNQIEGVVEHLTPEQIADKYQNLLPE